MPSRTLSHAHMSNGNKFPKLWQPVRSKNCQWERDREYANERERKWYVQKCALVRSLYQRKSIAMQQINFLLSLQGLFGLFFGVNRWLPPAAQRVEMKVCWVRYNPLVMRQLSRQSVKYWKFKHRPQAHLQLAVAPLTGVDRHRSPFRVSVGNVILAILRRPFQHFVARCQEHAVLS